MDLALTGFRVLITGGSAGIGRSAAELLAAEGARVAISSRNPEERAAAIGATPLAADLSTADGCAAAVEGAVAALGGLDGVVNNVGMGRIAELEEVADADWQAAWDTNVMSCVRVIRSSLPHLRTSEHAEIVHVSSTYGKPATGRTPQ